MEHNSTLLTVLLTGLAFPVLVSVGSGLIAKFLPRQKCADFVWGFVKGVLDACDKLLDLKVGNKTSAQIEESVFGTIGFVLQFVGAKILDWVGLNAKDSK